MPDAAPARSAVIRFRDADTDVEVDLRTGTVTRGGLRVRLPQQAFHLLRILLTAPGEPVTWQLLRDRLWYHGSEEEFASEIQASMARVREALGDAPERPRLVETVAGVGFRFTAPVEIAADSVSSRPGPSLSGPRLRSGGSSVQGREPSAGDGGWPTDGAPLPADTGRYELLERIGAGAMGEVFRARDLRLERDVAIKFLPDWMATDPLALHRFRREAHATASLNHPNVLAIHDLALIDGAPCLVAELLVGHTLRNTLAAGPLQVADAVGYAQQILDGLAAAHGNGIVHRDLKPENLFLTRDGHIKILDFGLAKQVLSDDGSTFETTLAPATRTGAVLGTLGYQSPEQARGEPVDVRTDLFAFGAVFYELLTGKRPFYRQTEADTIAAMLHEDPPPPSALNAAVPSSCDIIVAKALEKDRELRYQSAAEARADIRRVMRELGGGSTHASQSRGSLALPPRRRRRRTPLLLMSAGVVVLAAVVWLFASGDRGVPAFTPLQITHGTGLESEPAISPDSHFIAYTSDETGNEDIWLFDLRNRSTRNLTEHPSSDRHSTWAGDGSSLYFVSERDGTSSIWRVPVLGGPPARVIEDAEDVSVSPDGQSLAFSRRVDGYYRIFVVPTANSADQRQVTKTGNGLFDHRNPAWSPDSSRLCYVANREFWSVAAAGGNAQRILARGDFDLDPTWSSDGRAVYYSSSRGGGQSLWRARILPTLRDRLMFWRTDAARPVVGGSAPEQEPAVSRDGRQLAYSALVEDTNLALLDVPSGRVTQWGTTQNESFPALAPDGSRVYFISRADPPYNQVWALDLIDGKASGNARRLTEHTTGYVSIISCSPDGRWLAYYLIENQEGTSGKDTRRTIWVLSTAGGSPVRLTNGRNEREASWSPRSDALAYTIVTNDSGRIWKLPMKGGVAAGPPAPITSGTFDEGAPAWSPDGSLIAFLRTEPGTGASSVRVIKPDGTGEYGLTLNVKPIALAWDGATPGALFVSGNWDGKAAVDIRRVSAIPGRDVAPLPTLAIAPVPGSISATRDGRLVAYYNKSRRGNIWLLEASGRGRF